MKPCQTLYLKKAPKKKEQQPRAKVQASQTAQKQGTDYSIFRKLGGLLAIFSPKIK
jgi:hypothetical protein